MVEEPLVYAWNIYNVADPGQFNITLAALMNRLVNQAVSSSNFFAAGDVNIPDCCNGNMGGRVYGPSCNIRFEMYRFYTLASPPPTSPSPPENATPPSPPPASSTNSRGELGKRKKAGPVNNMDMRYVLASQLRARRYRGKIGMKDGKM
ncbi:hypothetical protein LWI29_010147 [Acer saccharum]|uniref:Gnk2-homologous domain-containing protein n=1 Tax=Acer saccharum TaxID=4024 RepID=A0AA39VI23_ACESA|nr:hypothetical protein LWI29_010147 [Acer saccharum]